MADFNLYSDSFLIEKRQSGDMMADAFIKQVFADPQQKIALQQWIAGADGHCLLGDLKQQYPDIALISNADQLPGWANRRLMKTGSEFFIRHAETIMSLLGLLSLPYCYTAANGAMVLYLSERIRTQTTKRLYETALFVWEVMAPDAFENEGSAYTEILKVRLMHAAVRYYTLQSGKWNQRWGTPINQEDMAGTNLSFSLIVIRGLRKMGFSVSQKDQEAFMHLWNVIGYFTGLEAEMIPQNAKQAQLLDSAISRRQFRVSAHGQALTQSLTSHILSINTSKASSNDILGLMRHLLGSEVADMLAINSPELPGYKLGLLRAMNLVKSFKPDGNLVANYNRDFAAFKSKKPA